MALDESDLQELRRDGARARRANGKPIEPLPAPRPTAEQEVSKITKAIQELGKAMIELAGREQVPAAAPHITVEAPKVTVKAPEVTVTPHVEIQPNQPLSLEAEVTERDRNGYTKKIVFRFL